MLKLSLTSSFFKCYKSSSIYCESSQELFEKRKKKNGECRVD